MTIEREDGTAVCERCLLASTPVTRARGLLGRSELPAGEGVLLRPAGSVHTMFMRFPIDVVFLDRELRVTGIRRDLAPWRVALERGARDVLELAAGECERRGLREGDRLVMV